MGEYADMAIDAALDPEWDDHEEAGFGGYRGPHRRRTRTCKQCGMRGLIWGHDEATGWRLYTTGGKLHNCHTDMDRSPKQPLFPKKG